MLPASGVASPSERVPTTMIPTMVQAMASEGYAKDAIIAWFRGEFAAANAIIDALCNHLRQLEEEGGGRSEYESVFAAIHRRRLNWIPILQMQTYHSVADVVLELGRVAAVKKVGDRVEGGEVKRSEEMKGLENEEGRSLVDCEEESVDEDSTRDDSPNSEVTGTGKTLSQKVQPPLGNKGFCSNHEECEARGAQIKKTKGYTAKEYVKGHMTNVVSGLKLFEDVFTDLELSKLNDFVDELQVAGQNGELSGETYILYNQQIKGTKRELIQFGTPIFGQIKEDAKPKDGNVHIESIPTLLQAVIDHLVQWHLISENRKPNSCIINFFDEGEFSQPFLKPPHLEQPISTLLLSESMMAFGQTLESDSDGNYKGSLMLSLKEGKQMQDRENRNINNPQPLGICKRLLNFIMNILTAQGLPHLTNPPASQSIPVPVEGSSAFREEHDYHPENSNSEIRVDFRHTNGLEHHAAKNDNAIVKGKKGGFRPVEIGIVRPTRNAEIDSRGQVNSQELNSITTGGSRAKPPTEVASINDSGGEKEKNNNKDKSTVAAEAKDTPMMPPFDFLEDDINGRADEFIRRRKMDFLRRNPTLDLPKSN